MLHEKGYVPVSVHNSEVAELFNLIRRVNDGMKFVKLETFFFILKSLLH